MKVSKFFIPFIVVLGITAFQSIFIVQEINQAIVLQFGDPKKIVNKSGLNFKLPFYPKRCILRQKSFKFR